MSRKIASRVAGVALTIVALATGACASAGGTGVGSVAVEVRNNLIPPTSLSIYVISDTGIRQLIGVVSPSATTTHTFSPSGVTGQYRLRAEPDSGPAINSQPLTISAGERVRWDVSANLATTERPGG